MTAAVCVVVQEDAAGRDWLTGWEGGEDAEKMQTPGSPGQPRDNFWQAHLSRRTCMHHAFVLA